MAQSVEGAVKLTADMSGHTYPQLGIFDKRSKIACHILRIIYLRQDIDFLLHIFDFVFCILQVNDFYGDRLVGFFSHSVDTLLSASTPGDNKRTHAPYPFQTSPKDPRPIFSCKTYKSSGSCRARIYRAEMSAHKSTAARLAPINGRKHLP
jgi:hypothetical protein